MIVAYADKQTHSKSSPSVWGESHFALRQFARRSRYLRHTCLRAWSHPHRCGRRCPWSLTDSCMSRCRGYRQSTAGGRCINKYKTGKACATRGECERVVCGLPLPCRSRGAGILRCRVYSRGRRSLCSTLQPEKHVHTHGPRIRQTWVNLMDWLTLIYHLSQLLK